MQESARGVVLLDTVVVGLMRNGVMMANGLLEMHAPYMRVTVMTVWMVPCFLSMTVVDTVVIHHLWSQLQEGRLQFEAQRHDLSAEGW